MNKRALIAIFTAAAVLTGCSAKEPASVNGAASGAPEPGIPTGSAVSTAEYSGRTSAPDTSSFAEPAGTSAAASGTSAAASGTSTAASGTSAPETARTTAPAEAHSDPAGSDYTGKDIGGRGPEDDPLYAGGAEAGGGFIAEAAVADGDYDVIDPGSPIDPIEPVPGWDIQPQAGLLTGGEWNDNENWDFWKGLYGSNNYGVDWSAYLDEWRTGAESRAAVRILDSAGNPVPGARVDGMGYSAVTDNSGMAYLFWEGSRTSDPDGRFSVTAPGGAESVFTAEVTGDCELEFTLDQEAAPAAKTLDLMIMCDTTGSMGDELEFLKEELEDVVKRIRQENANIPVRLSVNFYRDEGDEYVVREFPFTGDLDAAVRAIGEQSSDGGGDTPEAVHTALASAVDSHDWDADSVKVMFLVLDAPPHEDTQIIDEVVKHVRDAAEKGIRIVPVAASGVDKSCEYLLRSMAFMTGGTYTFLTDDSGIGYSHTEPTIGSYSVEKLNDMMVRIVGEYIGL